MGVRGQARGRESLGGGRGLWRVKGVGEEGPGPTCSLSITCLSGL